MLISNFVVDLERNQKMVRWVDYRLQITNLDDHAIDFLVEAHIQVSAEVAARDSLAHVEPPTAKRLTAGAEMSRSAEAVLTRSDVASWLVRVGAGASELFHLTRTLPSSAAYDAWVVPPEMGYVTLTVPPARERTGFKLGMQSSHPVPVLLAAWSRAYRAVVDLPIYDRHGVIYQEAAAGDDAAMVNIPLATSSALVEIEPDSFEVTDIRKAADRLRAAEGGHSPWVRGAEGLADEERVPALLDLLAGLGHVPAKDLAELNQLLERYGAHVRLRQ